MTHRGVATSFTVVTGHEDPSKPSEQTDWAALAAVPGTLVVLMGMGRLGDIAAALMAGGRPGDEPAAAVQWGATPRQRSVVATLATLARRVEAAGLGPPAVVVVGAVAALAPALAGAGARPLSGRRVVVTRARAQASELSERLRALGAAVTELPAIRIERLPDGPELESALAALGDYELVVLTSVNGVDALFDALEARGRDARSLPAAATIVAIGPATAERLARRGVRADLVPERFVAEGILDALAGRPARGRPRPGRPRRRIAPRAGRRARRPRRPRGRGAALRGRPGARRPGRSWPTRSGPTTSRSRRPRPCGPSRACWATATARGWARTGRGWCRSAR